MADLARTAARPGFMAQALRDPLTHYAIGGALLFAAWSAFSPQAAADDLRGREGRVGKTTIAASLAVAAARQGDRVRLVPTDPALNLGHLFGRPIGPGPVDLSPGLAAYPSVTSLPDARTVLGGHSRSMRRLATSRASRGPGRHPWMW